MDDEAAFTECYIKGEKSVFHGDLAELYDEGAQYSGSLVEGAMMARCFQNKEDWRELEIDVMLNIFSLPSYDSHLLEPVEDKPGFVRLHYQALPIYPYRRF